MDVYPIDTEGKTTKAIYNSMFMASQTLDKIRCISLKKLNAGTNIKIYAV